jgi:hypothetical protein
MLKWMAGLLLLLLTGALAAGVWLRDEPLRADAQHWLAQAQGTAPSQAYVQLLGLAAPRTELARTYGEKWLEAHWQWRATHPHDVPMPAPEPTLNLPELCRLVEPGCVARLKASQPLERWINEHDVLIERYLHLLSLEDYRSLSEPSADAPMPQYRALERANRLFAVHVLHLAETGRTDLAQRLLEGNVKRLRAWLAHADTLVLKVVLISLISQDLQTLAWLYHHDVIDLPRHQPALTAAELDFSAALAHEFATIAHGLLALPADAKAQGLANWQLRWLYKPHMTVNDLAARFARVQARARLDQAPLAHEHAGNHPTQNSDWRRWRNPMGQVLGAVAMPDMERYLMRRHDLARQLNVFNQLGRHIVQGATWDAERQAYCADAPGADELGLRCVPWRAPAL